MVACSFLGFAQQATAAGGIKRTGSRPGQLAFIGRKHLGHGQSREVTKKLMGVVKARGKAPRRGRLRRPPEDLLSQMSIKMQTLVRRLVRKGRPGIAAFDADGTLWSIDTGESFFHWMLQGKRFTKPEFSNNPAAEAAFYEQLNSTWRAYQNGTFNGEKMYELMATSMAGMREDYVTELARNFFRTHRRSIFRPMRLLIRTLDHIGIAPWVVSGSPVWIVAAGAAELGIPTERVIGLSVEVKDGVLTNRVVRPVPWKEGKSRRILKDAGERPLLVAGNSYGDRQMLELAELVQMAVNPGKYLRAPAEKEGMDVFSFNKMQQGKAQHRRQRPAPLKNSRWGKRKQPKVLDKAQQSRFATARETNEASKKFPRKRHSPDSPYLHGLYKRLKDSVR